MIRPGNDKFRARIKKDVPFVMKKAPPPPESPFLTFIVPCMGRLNFLKKSIDTVITQKLTKYILVDWSCPDHSGDWLEKNYPSAKVVRVPGQEFFNLSKARNAGGVEVDTPWICFLDVDMKLRPQFSLVVKQQAQPGRFGIFWTRSAGHAGTMIVRTNDFEAIRYNELMEGWGCEDDEFKHLLRYRLGLRAFRLTLSLAQHIDHGNKERTKFYKEKDVGKSCKANLNRRRDVNG